MFSSVYLRHRVITEPEPQARFIFYSHDTRLKTGASDQHQICGARFWYVIYYWWCRLVPDSSVD